jgi:hypothetical protein
MRLDVDMCFNIIWWVTQKPPLTIILEFNPSCFLTNKLALGLIHEFIQFPIFLINSPAILRKKIHNEKIINFEFPLLEGLGFVIVQSISWENPNPIHGSVTTM